MTRNHTASRGLALATVLTLAIGLWPSAVDAQDRGASARKRTARAPAGESTQSRRIQDGRDERDDDLLLAQAEPAGQENGDNAGNADAGNAGNANAGNANAGNANAGNANAGNANAGNANAGNANAGNANVAEGDESDAEDNDRRFTPDLKLQGKRVDITAGQVPVDEFMRFLADYTGKPVIFSAGTSAGAAARQAQTINITAAIYDADYHIVKAILDANGFLVVMRKLENDREIITVTSATGGTRGGDIKENVVIGIGPDGASLHDSELVDKDLDLENDEIATMVFTLEHVDPGDAIQSLNQLIGSTGGGGTTGGAAARSRGGSNFAAVLVRGTQTLIITAKFGLLDYILKLLKIVDVEEDLPKRIVHIIEAREADASELVSIIEQFLQESNRARNTSRPGVPRTSTTSSTGARRTPTTSTSRSRLGAQDFETALIADPRTQKIIVTTYNQQDLEDINMLIRELDTRFDIRRLKTQIYRMRYLKAIDVAAVITDVVGGGGGRSGTRGLGTSARSRNRIPGRAGVNTPGAGGAAAAARTGGVGGGANGVIPTLIVPHEETNSLIIQAEREDYAEILHILGEIDVKRRQVFLEAALVQVSAQSALNYTIELLAGDPDDRATRALFEQSFGLSGINTADFNRVFDLTNPPAGGLVAIMDRGKFPFLVSFLKSQSDTEVLATPFILADDNVQSTINITETRFVQNTSTVNTTTTSSQQGEDAGITLDIFPTINSENSVFLETGLEVSEFAQVETQNVLPPKTTNSITSSVTIAGDRIYVIGGLTRTTKGRVVDKLPLLGDIPLLGKLFRSEGTSHSVTNLYVFLRAHILTDKNFEDLGQLTDQAVEQAEQFGSRITEQFTPPQRQARSRQSTDPDDPRLIRQDPNKRRISPDAEDIHRRAVEARDSFRSEEYQGDSEGAAAHGDEKTGGNPGGTGTPTPNGNTGGTGTPTPNGNTGAGTSRDEIKRDLDQRVRDAAAKGQLDNLGSPTGTPTGNEQPATKGNIPESWKERGLEVDPDSDSWFVPLRPKKSSAVSSEG